LQDEVGATAEPLTRAQVLLKPPESGLRQMIRFALVGAVATVFDYAVLLILYDVFHVSQWISVAAGYGVGLIVCYILSIVWVFPYRSISNKHIEFAVFIIIGVVGLVLTEIVVEVTLRIMSLTPNLTASLGGAVRLSAAKLIAIIIVFFFNFRARKVTMFTRPKER